MLPDRAAGRERGCATPGSPASQAGGARTRRLRAPHRCARLSRASRARMGERRSCGEPSGRRPRPAPEGTKNAPRRCPESVTQTLTPPPAQRKHGAVPDGWTAAGGARDRVAGGKSGLHGNTVPVNDRRGRPQGQCHRKQTARSPQGHQARVKRCGKSAPRPRQRGRQGKPHREQGRIGGAGAAPQGVGAGAFPPCPSGWPREACGDAGSRGMVVPCLRAGTEPGLQAIWHHLSPGLTPCG